MAAPKLVVNGFDLSSYLDVQHEDGLDPSAPGYYSPQFGGTPALGEGKRWVANTADNRDGVFPVLLEANSRAELHALAGEINNQLVRNALVEFSSDSKDASSYFTLEGGHLDVKYEYFLTGVALTTRATLYLSMRPYAHTGTARLVASIPQGSSAVVEFPASGILGDANALVNLEVRVGSAVASAGRVVMYGQHPHPSHNPYRPATSTRAQAGATVRGASGAIGSQYTAIPVSPTGASGIAYREFLDPPAAHVGRHRVFGIGRSGLTAPISVYAADRFGAILGATAVVSQIDVNKWQLFDLGEIQVPARASGQEAVPTQYVDLHAGGTAGGAVAQASPAFHLNGLIFLPLDYSAGIMRTAGAQQHQLYADDFFRVGDLAEGVFGVGPPWSYDFGRAACILTTNIMQYSVGKPTSGASFLANMASGVRLGDVGVSFGLALYGGSTPSTFASGAAWEAWAKHTPSTPSAGVWTKLVAGPSQSLQLWGGNGASTALLASAGIPSTLASGIWQGQLHRLRIQTLGNRADVWLGTTITGSPILSASHVFVGQVGNPAMGGANGAASWSPGGFFGITYGPEFRAFRVEEVGEEAIDIGPREWFRFESYPEGRVVQGNASIFRFDRLDDYRGGFPKAVPVGSGAKAQGPLRMVVFAGEIDNVLGNDGPSIGMAAVERFRFLR